LLGTSNITDSVWADGNFNWTCSWEAGSMPVSCSANKPPPPPLVSCLDIKTNNPSATSWNYDIQPSWSASVINVYCDMTTEWGWWTRVSSLTPGNVVPNVDTPFTATQKSLMANEFITWIMFKSKVTNYVRTTQSFANYVTVSPNTFDWNVDNAYVLPVGTLETFYDVFYPGTSVNKKLDSTMWWVPTTMPRYSRNTLAARKKIAMFRTNWHYWSNFWASRFNTDTWTVDYVELYVK
jgi:hypothetical protein